MPPLRGLIGCVILTTTKLASLRDVELPKALCRPQGNLPAYVILNHAGV